MGIEVNQLNEMKFMYRPVTISKNFQLTDNAFDGGVKIVRY